MAYKLDNLKKNNKILKLKLQMQKNEVLLIKRSFYVSIMRGAYFCPKK